MKLVLAAAVFVGAIFASASAESKSSRTLDLRDFDAIEISGAYELDVIVGEDFSVELSGPSEEMTRVEATLKNGALVLGSKKRIKGGHKGVRAVVTMPALSRIAVSGVADADVSGVEADHFKLDLSGVGEVNIAGECETLIARVSGVGEVDAQSLQCKSVDVKVAWGDISDVSERDRGADEARTIEVADFDRIDIAGVVELDATVGGDYSLTLSGRVEDLDRARAEVVDGKLILDTAHNEGRVGRKIIRHGVTATITMPALTGVDAAGVVDGSVKGIAGGAFSVDISGVGDLKLSGACDALEAEVSGVGDLEAKELECRTVDVEVSGIGGASVFASESANAEIAGIGKIEIYGSPPSVSKSNTSPLGRISVK